MNAADALPPATAEPPGADTDAVAVTDLRVHFPLRTGVLRRVTGTAHAVDGVSFTVPARSIVTIVGESGSGKTTTGRALVGLSPVTSGRVSIHGRPLEEIRRAGRCPGSPRSSTRTLTPVSTRG